MTLPQLTDLTTDVTIELADHLIVTFQLAPIPGKTYQEILLRHRDATTGDSSVEAMGLDLLKVGVRTVYSSVESTPVPWTDADAVEFWDTWPEFARQQLLIGVYQFATNGPVADPFGKSAQRKPADK
jgi:hypothetical protein